MDQWCSSGLNLKAGAGLISAVVQPGLSAPRILQVQAGSTDVNEAEPSTYRALTLFLATIDTWNITRQWTVQARGTLPTHGMLGKVDHSVPLITPLHLFCTKTFSLSLYLNQIDSRANFTIQVFPWFLEGESSPGYSCSSAVYPLLCCNSYS